MAAAVSVQVSWIGLPTSHPWDVTSSTSPWIRASASARTDPRKLVSLRARRALRLRADGARRKRRLRAAKELRAERVQVGDVHQPVVRVITRRLVEERLARQEVLTEHVQVRDRNQSRGACLTDQVVRTKDDRGQEDAIGTNLNRGSARLIPTSDCRNDGRI